MAKQKARTPEAGSTEQVIGALQRVFDALVQHVREDPSLARALARALAEPPGASRATSSPPDAPRVSPAATRTEAPAAPKRGPKRHAEPEPKPEPKAKPMPEPAPEPKPEPKRAKAVIDPFALYDQGWEAMLRAHLDRLTLDQLRDVIHQYRLDPKGQTEKESSAERLRDWVVRSVEDLGSRL